MTAKFLPWLASPLTLALLAAAWALVAGVRGRRRTSCRLLAGIVVWLLVWSSPLFYRWFGGALERPYPPLRAGEMPRADAIVLLGGGMSAPYGLPYPDMSGSADRVWHAARLYHAGRAPLVIASGSEEAASSALLLQDLGVPAAAIRVEGESRNTAGNAACTRRLLDALGARRVLLVTSALHMRRARLLFERSGVEVIPAATDHEATARRSRPDRWSLAALLPSAEMLERNSCALKERLGYWACRLTGRSW